MKLTLNEIKTKFEEFRASKTGKSKVFYPMHLQTLAVKYARGEKMSFTELSAQIGVAANTIGKWSAKVSKTDKNVAVSGGPSAVQLRVVEEKVRETPEPKIVEKERENIVVFVMKKESLNEDFFSKIAQML